MPETYPVSIDPIFIAFDKRFQVGVTKAPVWWNKVATLAPSTSRENRYPWLDKVPRLKKWVGERVINAVKARGYTIVNDDYEDTISLDRNVIQDDGLGVYGPAIDMLADAAAHWPDDLIASIMQAGATNTCYDGQPFFSANHPQDMDVASSPVQSNLFSSATSGAMPLTSANYSTVRAAMMNYVSVDGKPLNINPNVLIVPPSLETTAKQILNAQITAPAAPTGQNAAAAAQDNVLKGTAEPIVISQLGNESTAWYLMDTTKGIMPFIFQQRMAPRTVPLVAQDSPNMFWRKELIYGVDARGAAGYSFWYLCARCVG